MMRGLAVCVSVLACAAAFGAGPADSSAGADGDNSAAPLTAVLDRALSAYDAGARALAAHQDSAQALFKESAALLQALADGAPGGKPIHNAGLYYDMGNAYLLAGDPSRAVLNYRRAARLAPLNIDIKKNLSAARERVGAGAAAEQPGAMSTILAYVESVPAQTRFTAFVCAFIVLFLLLLGRLTRARVRPARWMAAAAGTIAALSLATLVVPAALHQRAAAVVIVPQIIGRSGPDDVTYEPDPPSPIKGGTEVSILRERAGWALLELPGNRQTWTPVSAIERVDPD